MEWVNSEKEILDYLSWPITTLEIELIEKFHREIKKYTFDPAQVTPKDWKEFSIRRIFGSGSLGQGQEIETWDQVNLYIHKKISENATLELESFKEINTILRPENSGEYRKTFCRGGEKCFLRPEDISFFLHQFDQFILKKGEDISGGVIWLAFMVYSWGISIHPFVDGNGRTFRSSADLILMKASYLPLTYLNNIEAHVAVVRNIELPIRSKVFQRFLNGILNSYKFLHSVS